MSAAPNMRANAASVKRALGAGLARSSDARTSKTRRRRTSPGERRSARRARACHRAMPPVPATLLHRLDSGRGERIPWPMLTRTIPHTGEALPVLGLGTFRAFDQSLTAAPVRDALAEVL